MNVTIAGGLSISGICHFMVTVGLMFVCVVNIVGKSWSYQKYKGGGGNIK